MPLAEWLPHLHTVLAKSTMANGVVYQNGGGVEVAGALQAVSDILLQVRATRVQLPLVMLRHGGASMEERSYSFSRASSATLSRISSSCRPTNGFPKIARMGFPPSGNKSPRFPFPCYRLCQLDRQSSKLINGGDQKTGKDTDIQHHHHTPSSSASSPSFKRAEPPADFSLETAAADRPALHHHTECDAAAGCQRVVHGAVPEQHLTHRRELPPARSPRTPNQHASSYKPPRLTC